MTRGYTRGFPVTIRTAIMGVNGYGGSELLRLCAAHTGFQVVKAYGESTAGQTLAQRFPSLRGQPLGDVTIDRFDPSAVDVVDLLFASLPTGQSREPLAKVPAVSYTHLTLPTIYSV